MKPSINRRRFLSLAAAGSAGGLLIPMLVRSGSGPIEPPNGPYITQTAFYTIIIQPDGSFTLPPGCPVAYHAINEAPLGGIYTVYPAQPAGAVPLYMQQAFDYYAKNNPPAGFTTAQPQVALVEVVVGLAILAGGAWFCWKLYKWASTGIKPPPTNVDDEVLIMPAH